MRKKIRKLYACVRVCWALNESGFDTQRITGSRGTVEVDKLIIGVDETLLNRMEDTERIKNLSTAFTYKIEGDRKSVV